jgi:hypothetical protein
MAHVKKLACAKPLVFSSLTVVCGRCQPCQFASNRASGWRARGFSAAIVELVKKYLLERK